VTKHKRTHKWDAAVRGRAPPPGARALRSRLCSRPRLKPAPARERRARAPGGGAAPAAPARARTLPRPAAPPPRRRPAPSQIWRPPRGGAPRGRQVFLGSYDGADEAARAYDRAALALFGRGAVLNVRPGRGRGLRLRAVEEAGATAAAAVTPLLPLPPCMALGMPQAPTVFLTPLPTPRPQFPIGDYEAELGELLGAASADAALDLLLARRVPSGRGWRRGGGVRGGGRGVPRSRSGRRRPAVRRGDAAPLPEGSTTDVGSVSGAADASMSEGGEEGGGGGAGADGPATPAAAPPPAAARRQRARRGGAAGGGGANGADGDAEVVSAVAEGLAEAMAAAAAAAAAATGGGADGPVAHEAAEAVPALLSLAAGAPALSAGGASAWQTSHGARLLPAAVSVQPASPAASPPRPLAALAGGGASLQPLLAPQPLWFIPPLTAAALLPAAAQQLPMPGPATSLAGGALVAACGGDAFTPHPWGTPFNLLAPPAGTHPTAAPGEAPSPPGGGIGGGGGGIGGGSSAASGAVGGAPDGSPPRGTHSGGPRASPEPAQPGSGVASAAGDAASALRALAAAMPPPPPPGAPPPPAPALETAVLDAARWAHAAGEAARLPARLLYAASAGVDAATRGEAGARRFLGMAFWRLRLACARGDAGLVAAWMRDAEGGFGGFGIGGGSGGNKGGGGGGGAAAAGE
jgi:hypothetical protein